MALNLTISGELERYLASSRADLFGRLCGAVSLKNASAGSPQAGAVATRCHKSRHGGHRTDAIERRLDRKYSTTRDRTASGLGYSLTGGQGVAGSNPAIPTNVYGPDRDGRSGPFRA